MTALLPDAMIAVWQWLAYVARVIWGTWWTITEGLSQPQELTGRI